MPTPRRTHRLPTFLLGCLTAALLTTQAVAANPGLTLIYTDGQTDATGYDTTAPNSPTKLSILSGTATQSGVLTGSGSVIKRGAGTLILSGANDYTGTTTLNAGTLQVAAGGAISHSSANLFVASDNGDVATLFISGGSVSNNRGILGNDLGSFGTATMSGGTWTNNSNLYLGWSGTGVLNLSAGTVINQLGVIGLQFEGSGTANVSGGTWTNLAELYIGNSGSGVLNLSGGSVSNTSGYLGWEYGSSGTANVSGGTWTNDSELYLGYDGTGVLNLTGSGTVSVGNGPLGPLYLAYEAGSSGTLNIGTGGLAGTLIAASVTGGDGTAVVNFNHTGDYTFSPVLSGSMTVNHIGPGSTLLTEANTYAGATNVFGGRLVLSFAFTPSDILPSTTDLTLGSAALHLSSDASQTLNTLSTRNSGAGRIVLEGGFQTLDIGSLGSANSSSALNFNTAAGGADGDTVGTGVIRLGGQTEGEVIRSNFTVTDSTGFGLATVDGSDQIIRLTTTALLPASGADSSTDYRIDNNSGDSTTAGSSSLILTGSQSARSITVDTTQDYGTLTLGSGVVLSSDVWNFGGVTSHPYEIIGSDSGAGITTANSGATFLINNFNYTALTISAPILDNGGTALQVAGLGTTILSGTNSYTDDTLITSGTLVVADTGSINSLGTTRVGSQTGDHAELVIYGSVHNVKAVIGDEAGSSGTVTVSQPDSNGSWHIQTYLNVGLSGTGVLNITESGVVELGVGSVFIGSNVGSSGTVNVTGGLGLGELYVGYAGTGALNIDQGGLVESGTALIGVEAGSSGTVTVSNGGDWEIDGNLSIGQGGTGVLNLTNLGSVSFGGMGFVTIGAQGTVNIGTGGVAGYLFASTVSGSSGAVVNYNYNDLGRFKSGTFGVLTGDLSVNKLGGGYLSFYQQNTYTGGTTVNGGTLELDFYDFDSDLISSQSALTLGGGTLRLYNESGSGVSQTLNGLTTTAGTGSQIYLSSDVTLNLGALTSAGSDSALNFDLYDGGADGGHVGTGIVLLSGQTSGSVINTGFTVTDSTGFGLATVNEFNQIIRLTNTDLLPASGAVVGMDYRIDNHSGDDNSDPGNSSLEITASQTVRSITVDVTHSSGQLILDPGVMLSSEVWNFGGRYAYEITGWGSGAGITTATAGGMLQINNFNYDGVVTISTSILDAAGSGLRVAGPDGLTILAGADTYTGETIINNGTLFINGDHTGATGEIIVQSSAELAGIGQIGSNIHVLNGGMLTPGTIGDLGTLTGTTASFDTNSIFHLVGGGDTMGTLHLTGAVTIASGALLYIDTYDDLTLSQYTLMTADGGGLDGSNPFTLGFTGFHKKIDVIPGYHLVYTGNTLELVSDVTAPVTAYWTGKADHNWSALNSGTTNWATAADGLTDTGALPDSPTNVTFSATGTGPVQTNLDTNFTVNTLTVNSDTSISNDTDTDNTHTLTVNSITTVNARLTLHTGVTLVGNGSLTIDTTGTLAGSGEVHMENDQSMFVNGSISVGDPSSISPQVLNLYANGPTGTGAIVMGLDSTIRISLNTGAGLGDNAYIGTAAGVLNLHGVLDATAGGTLVLENPNHMTAYAGGDQWRVFDFNSGEGNITGHLGLNDSALGLATGYIGTFNQDTGIYSIADHRAEMTTQSSGIPMANAEGPAIISGSQTATSDINTHLFNLRSGGGEEGDDDEGGISASLDYGVVMGEGDGPEDKNPIAKKVLRTRQWEVFTTVNYGNVKLNPISSQSGVQIDSWASSVGIERHLSRGLTLGFAVTFLQSTQTYTGGLGKLDLEGPNLSTYLSYVRGSFWGSLLYSFGDYDLGSSRNPGLGLPTAAGATNAYTNAIQYNTGWNFHFLQDRSLVTGPFIGIDYLHGTVDAYSETGGGAGALRYARQTFESLVTRVGWSTSKKFETTWAAISPQFRLSYERQNLKNNGSSVSLINAPFTATGGNQSPGQDYMVLGTGVNFQFTPDFSMLLGYQVQLFRNSMEAHFGSVRFGYKF